MAQLTPQELRVIRNAMERYVNGLGVTYTKAHVAAAAQALEDLLVASKPALNTTIETAAPGVFSPAQKKRLLAFVVLRFANAENA